MARARWSRAPRPVFEPERFKAAGVPVLKITALRLDFQSSTLSSVAEHDPMETDPQRQDASPGDDFCQFRGALD